VSASHAPWGEDSAKLGPDGKVIPGPWLAPGRGTSRFHTEEQARDQAARIVEAYGPCFETKVEKEPSRSRPGRFAWQVYLRSMGYIEGLVKP